MHTHMLLNTCSLSRRPALSSSLPAAIFPPVPLAYAAGSKKAGGDADNEKGLGALVARARAVLDDAVCAGRSFLRDMNDVIAHSRIELVQATATRLLVLTLLHPLDVVKVRVQASARTAPPAIEALRRGSLFAGLAPALFGRIPYGVLTFTLFTVLQRRLDACTDHGVTNARVRALLAACGADALAAAVIAPVETIKVRIASGMAPTIASAAKQGRFITSALSAQIVRDLPFRVLFLVGYDAVRSRVLQHVNKDLPSYQHTRSLNTVQTIGTAAVTAAAAAAVTNPLDVVRSRIMAQHPDTGKLYANWLHCLGRTLKHEGPLALARGLVPRTVYMATTAVVFCVAFERVRDATQDKLVELTTAAAQRKKY